MNLQHARKTRADSLAGHLARGRIDRPQYLAAVEFRRIYALAESGHPDSAKSLARCFEQLGGDRVAVVTDALIKGMATREIAKSRDRRGRSGSASTRSGCGSV